LMIGFFLLWVSGAHYCSCVLGVDRLRRASSLHPTALRHRLCYHLLGTRSRLCSPGKRNCCAALLMCRPLRPGTSLFNCIFYPTEGRARFLFGFLVFFFSPSIEVTIFFLSPFLRPSIHHQLCFQQQGGPGHAPGAPWALPPA